MIDLHWNPSPFPYIVGDGTRVVDELCSCGHKRSEHEDRHHAYGHGACYFDPPSVALSSCECERFTWVGMVEVKPVPDVTL